MADLFAPQIGALSSPGASGYVSQPVKDTTMQTAVQGILPLAEAATADIYGASKAKEVQQIGQEIGTAQQALNEAEAQWRNAPESQRMETLAQAVKAGGNIHQLRLKARTVQASAINAMPHLRDRIKRQFRMSFGDGVDPDKQQAETAQEVSKRPLSQAEQWFEAAKKKAKRDGSTIQEAVEELEYGRAQAMRRRQEDKYGQAAAVGTHQFGEWTNQAFTDAATANGGFLDPKQSKKLAQQVTYAKETHLAALYEQCTQDGAGAAECQEIVNKADKQMQSFIDTYQNKYDMVKAIERDRKTNQTITRFNLQQKLPWVIDMQDTHQLTSEQVGSVIQWVSGNTEGQTTLMGKLSPDVYNKVEDLVRKSQKTMHDNGWTIEDCIYHGDSEGLRAMNGQSTSIAANKRVAGKGATPRGTAFGTASMYADSQFGDDAFTYGMSKNPNTTQELNENMVKQDPRFFAVFNAPHMTRVLNMHPEYADQMNGLVQTNVVNNIRPLLSQSSSDTNVGIRETDQSDYVERKGEAFVSILGADGKTHNLVITTSADLSTQSGQQAVSSIEDSLQFYYNNPKFGADPIKRVQGMVNQQPEEEIVSTTLESENGEEFVPPSLDETPLSIKPRGVETLSDGNVAEVLNTNQAKRYYTRNPEKRGEVEPALVRYMNNRVVPFMGAGFQGNLVIEGPKVGGDPRGEFTVNGEPVEANVRESLSRALQAVKRYPWLLEDDETPEEYVEDLVNSQYTTTGEVETPVVEEVPPEQPQEAMGRLAQERGQVDTTNATVDWSRSRMQQQQPQREPSVWEQAGQQGSVKQPEREEGVLQPESPEDVKGKKDEPTDQYKNKVQWETFADEQIERGTSLDRLHQNWEQMFGPESDWTSTTKRDFMVVANRYRQQGGKMEEFE